MAKFPSKWKSSSSGGGGSVNSSKSSKYGEWALEYSVVMQDLSKSVDDYVRKVYDPARKRLATVQRGKRRVLAAFSRKIRMNDRLSKSFVKIHGALPTAPGNTGLGRSKNLSARNQMKLDNRNSRIFMAAYNDAVRRGGLSIADKVLRSIKEKSKRAQGEAARVVKNAYTGPIAFQGKTKFTSLSNKGLVGEFRSRKQSIMETYLNFGHKAGGESSNQILARAIAYLSGKMDSSLKTYLYEFGLIQNEMEKRVSSGKIQKKALAFDLQSLYTETGKKLPRSTPRGRTGFIGQIKYTKVFRSVSDLRAINEEEMGALRPSGQVGVLKLQRDISLKYLDSKQSSASKAVAIVKEKELKLRAVLNEVKLNNTGSVYKVFRRESDSVLKNVMSRYRLIYPPGPRSSKTIDKAMKKSKVYKVYVKNSGKSNARISLGIGNIKELNINTSIYRQYDADKKQWVDYKPPVPYRVKSWWIFREYSGAGKKVNFKEPVEQYKRYVRWKFGLGGFAEQPMFKESSVKYFDNDFAILNNIANKIIKEVFLPRMKKK